MAGVSAHGRCRQLTGRSGSRRWRAGTAPAWGPSPLKFSFHLAERFRPGRQADRDVVRQGAGRGRDLAAGVYAFHSICRRRMWWRRISWTRSGGSSRKAGSMPAGSISKSPKPPSCAISMPPSEALAGLPRHGITGLAGRFRHRLFQPEPRAPAQTRKNQDRPKLRHRHQRRPRIARHRADNRRSVPDAGYGMRRGRRGDRSANADPEIRRIRR